MATEFQLFSIFALLKDPIVLCLLVHLLVAIVVVLVVQSKSVILSVKPLVGKSSNAVKRTRRLPPLHLIPSVSKGLRCVSYCVLNGLVINKCQPAGIPQKPAPYPQCELKGQSCGGLIKNAPVCKPGLTCQASNVPDLPGTCIKS